MTREEYVEKLREIEDSIKRLERDKRRLNKEYVNEHAEHKVGQKAIVTTTNINFRNNEKTVRKFNVYVWKNSVFDDGEIRPRFRSYTKGDKPGNEKMVHECDSIEWLDEYLGFYDKVNNYKSILSSDYKNLFLVSLISSDNILSADDCERELENLHFMKDNIKEISPEGEEDFILQYVNDGIEILNNDLKRFKEEENANNR